MLALKQIAFDSIKTDSLHCISNPGRVGGGGSEGKFGAFKDFFFSLIDPKNQLFISFSYEQFKAECFQQIFKIIEIKLKFYYYSGHNI